MTRIAVLNLTRLGDLVQTSPVMSGLRRAHPDAELHLIVKSRFRSIAQLLPCVDQIHEIDGDVLARALGDPERGFLDAYRSVTEIAERLGSQGFDRVVNFTHSRASAALMSLIGAPESVGYNLDREGLRLVENPWLAHMGVIVRARRLSRLNLVDVYLGAAGLGGADEALSLRVPDTARRRASGWLAGPGPFVGVQLGASQDQKTWPVERFAATLRALHARRPVRVVLFGVRGERPSAEALQTRCPELAFVDLVGETEVPELAAALERVDLLLTGDTGTMHLAAAVGTRTVSVFVGLSNPWETAVYAEGHLVVTSRVECAPCAHHVVCGNPICHSDIPGDWLAELIHRELDRRPLEGLAALPRADAFRTAFDRHGLLDLVPLRPRAAQGVELMALAYREWFAETLGLGRFDPERVLEQARLRHGLEPGDWHKALPEGLSDALARLAELGERGARLAEALTRSGPSRISELGRELCVVDDDALAIARSQPLCAPFGLALEGGLEGLPAGNLPELARRSARHYAALGRGSRLIGELIRGGTA